MTTPVPNPLEVLSLDQLRARTSEKWRRYPDDVLPLWVAELDVLPAEPVTEAITNAMVTGDTGYPSGDVYPRALRDFAARRWGWEGYQPERMITVTDVMSAIAAVVNVLSEPGDTVIVCSPVYPPFYGYMKAAGRRVQEAPLNDDGRVDLDSLRSAFRTARETTGQPVLLLSNPHNPTGVAHTREELEAVAAVAREFGGRVVSDEIHSPLVLAGAEFVPFLSVAGAENGFSVFSSSKAWNLPGLKAAVLSAGPEAARDLRRIPGTLQAGASHLGIVAHSAALEHGGPWLDALLDGLNANRELLSVLVAEHLPGVRMRPPQATYLAWLDCHDLDLPRSGSGRSGDFGLTGPAAYFFDEARVALNDGATFGTSGAGHVRVNYGTSSSILSQAIGAMGEAADRASGKTSG